VIAQVNQWIVEEARHSSDEDDRDDGEEAGSGSSGDQGSDNVAGESDHRTP
jgi:hypothetical protein